MPSPSLPQGISAETALSPAAKTALPASSEISVIYCKRLLSCRPASLQWPCCRSAPAQYVDKDDPMMVRRCCRANCRTAAKRLHQPGSRVVLPFKIVGSRPQSRQHADISTALRCFGRKSRNVSNSPADRQIPDQIVLARCTCSRKPRQHECSNEKDQARRCYDNDHLTASELCSAGRPIRPNR